MHNGDAVMNHINYNQMNIIELFENQVNLTPGNLAVSFNNETLTYLQLNNYVNQFTKSIVATAIKKNSFIGIYMDRSLEMVISILSVLKAGCAYVPLDPDYPKDRITYMIKNSGIELLITQTKYQEFIQGIDGLEKVILAEQAKKILEFEPESQESPNIISKGVEPAYLIYTSGTTGNPKSVVIPHQAILNHMLWMKKEFPLQFNDKVLQKTPFSFDASIWEFFAPLISGAVLVMAPTGLQTDIKKLIRFIKNNDINILQVVPSMLHLLIEEKEFKEITSLNYVFCGGEVLSTSLKDRFYKYSSATLVNLYGPTEACIDSTFHICSRDSHYETIPIGMPIDNVSTLIVDESGIPVSPGTTGELLIGGLGLATEYLNLPKLTDQKFINISTKDSSYKRYYKTGDLVKKIDSGDIEFIGRRDNLVKIRGFFIDTDEIENKLQQHKDINQAVVKVVEINNIKFIVAYLLPNKEKILNSNNIFRFVSGKLPSNMLPNYYVFLKSFPKTSSGKIDKQSLPMPIIKETSVSNDEKKEISLSSHEKELKKIFEKTFNYKNVNINDNFFEIGGHSLLAISILSEVRELFLKEISLKQFFDTPTIAGLAKLLLNTKSENASRRDIEYKTNSNHLSNQDMNNIMNFLRSKS